MAVSNPIYDYVEDVYDYAYDYAYDIASDALSLGTTGCFDFSPKGFCNTLKSKGRCGRKGPKKVCAKTCGAC